MTEKILQASKQQTVTTLGAIPLTMKLIASELRWSVVRFLRSIEIRQLEKRLAREYQQLGQISASQKKNADNDTELCQKQIDFLEKELLFLKQELTDLRNDMIVKRCRKWGLDKSQKPTEEENAQLLS
jgi:hypothetical protein